MNNERKVLEAKRLMSIIDDYKALAEIALEEERYEAALSYTQKIEEKTLKLQNKLKEMV